MTTDLAALANARLAGPRHRQCGADYAIETAHNIDPTQGELVEQAIANPHAPATAVADAIDELIDYHIQAKTISRHRARRCACKENQK